MKLVNTPLIKTNRLVLKELNKDNALDMFEYRSDTDIQKYQSFKPKNLKEVIQFINDNTCKFNVENSWYQLGIFLEEKLIGDLGIHFMGPNNMQCEIGYTISTNYQHKGFGKESVEGLVTYLFKTMQKHRIIASLDPQNTPSQILLERLGFRKEGLFKRSIYINNTWEDDVIYAITHDEWDK